MWGLEFFSSPQCRFNKLIPFCWYIWSFGVVLTFVSLNVFTFCTRYLSQLLSFILCTLVFIWNMSLVLNFFTHFLANLLLKMFLLSFNVSNIQTFKVFSICFLFICYQLYYHLLDTFKFFYVFRGCEVLAPNHTRLFHHTSHICFEYMNFVPCWFSKHI